MSTSGAPGRTPHPAPSRGSPQPASAPDAHRTNVLYVGAAAVLVLAVTRVGLVLRPHGSGERRRADDARTPVSAEAHQQQPAAEGDADGVYGHGAGGAQAAALPSHAPAPWVWTVRQRASAALQATAALVFIAVALAPPVLELAERNVRAHHLEHAALLGGGGVLGLVLGMVLRPPGHRFPWDRFPLRRSLALGVVLLGPLLVMAAMIPSTSTWIDAHPLAHALEHLALIVLGGVIGLSARLFSTALGWLVVALVAGMAATFGGMALAHPLDLLVAGLRALILIA